VSGEPTNPRVLWPFLGRAPALPPETLRTLLLVTLGVFFEQYDLGLVSAALPQIAAGLGIPAEDTGFYLSAIRLGGVGSFLLIPFADRVGRRRAFLGCFAGMSLFTFATACAQTPLQFTLAQMLTRAFMLTAASLAVVILVEELPAEQRGGGLGVLSILGGMGFGLGAGLYAAIDHLPLGWRSLYAVGLAPVLLLPFFRRALRETRRFEGERRAREAGAAAGAAGWLEPLRALARTHPRRAATIGAAGFLTAVGGIAFFQYTSWFVHEVHGWAPFQYSLLVVGGGMIGMLGTAVGGRGSDLFGRRRVGASVLALMPLLVALFYGGPALSLVPAWGFAVLCGTSSEIVLRALATELFPTSHRASAGGWLVLVETLGWSAGLLACGLFARSAGDLPRVIIALGAASFLAAVCLLAVPETRGRELEEIAEVGGVE
jgi:putative MFS transporter